MTFKDLKKKVSLEVTQQQFRLFERLHNKPFWIWNVEEHRRADIRTDGYCCFNHVLGLPQKDYDYQKIIFDSLDKNKYLDKESNRFRDIRIHASVHGLALPER
jgi:hypothetical protein